MKNKSGITLIALVITIIVLLVLAGVSLSLVLGDNGVLKKAQTATTETRNSEEKEKIEMAVAAARAAGNGVLTTENLNTELGKTFGEDKTVEEINTRRLPNEYQEVEYIESTGTQWMDIGYKPKTNTELNLELSFNGNFTGTQSGNTVLFGSYSDDRKYCFQLNFGGNSNEGNTLYAWVDKTYSNGGQICSFTISDNTRTNKNLIVMKSGKITYGASSRNLEVKTTDLENSMILYGCRKVDGSINIMDAYNMTVYGLKIFESDALKRNYIPCYSTTAVTDANGNECQSGTKGLYDLVEGKFYTNQNSIGVDFKAGKNIELSDTPEWIYKLDVYRKYIINSDGKVNISMFAQDSIEVEKSNSIKLVLSSNYKDEDIIWSSSDNEIATVSNDGTVTGINKGTAIIKAKCDNNNIQDICEVNVTPLYIIKDGKLIDKNYILPTADANSTFTQNDGYLEFYAFTPNCYKTGVSWKIDKGTNFNSATIKWTAPERSDSAAWGTSVFASNQEAIYDYSTEKYPLKYGWKSLFANNANVVTSLQTTTMNLNFKGDSSFWYTGLQTYYRGAPAVHWRKFKIYEFSLE